MFVLYVTPDCPRCSDIRSALEELAIAHRVVEVPGPPEGRTSPEGVSGPPALVDGDDVFQGSRAILDHLEEIERFKELWYKFQSDACYCDEEGNVQ